MTNKIPTTADILDRLQNVLGVDSDHQIHKKTKISQVSISKYRTCLGAFDERASIIFADLLGENPLVVIAIANHQRAIKDPRKPSSESDWWAQKYFEYTQQ